MRPDANLIRNRVVKLQQELLESQTRLASEKSATQDAVDSLVLDVIEGIEALTSIRPTFVELIDPSAKKASRALLALGKIVKRFERMLRENEVEKIEFPDGRVIAGKCRVVSTERESGREDGDIVSIIRNGYTREGRVIRPADVITVRNV